LASSRRWPRKTSPTPSHTRCGRGDASPRGADLSQDNAGQRPRHGGRHALGRDPGLVLRPWSRCGRARECTRGRAECSRQTKGASS
jgi:hypothetical protein